MKYISEFRNPEAVEKLLSKIKRIVTQKWHIMEVCGGQTHSLVKNGIINLLPQEIEMIHGPGCPVCVTPIALIDKAIKLAIENKVILCSFGDMLRVPGTSLSLLEAKAKGADIRILYSPLDAVKIAKENLDKEVVFFAVGFETTAPANALSVMHAQKQGLNNYSILTSHVLVPPAMELIMQDTECIVNGFLGAGHVCTIMGIEEYEPLVQQYKIPIVITGFEPVDLLEGILMVVQQLEKGEYQLENQYSRVVKPEGNRDAQLIMKKVFTIADREWRGIGNIPHSGYEVREEYKQYDANVKFDLKLNTTPIQDVCLSGDIMKGKIKPYQCPHFGKKCTPSNPLGAPMVSSEGACAAYYNYNVQ